MEEVDSETEFFAFPLLASERKIDHLTVSSDVLWQRHFGPQYTFYTQFANRRPYSLNSYAIFFKYTEWKM